MTEELDFGFSFVSEQDVTETVVEQQQEILNEYSKAVESFLTKLASNPEKDTIKWPNRSSQIKEFLEELNKIKTGYKK